MRHVLSALRFMLVACAAAGLWVPFARADGPPPNWKGGGTGSTRPGDGGDVDTFGGQSTHLGRFTGAGLHVLNPLDFTFVGETTWTAANGDTLSVTYAGYVFPSGDPDYPYGFQAVLVADGGTGRLAGASGTAVMTGGFTGVPGDLFFDFSGTLQTREK